MNIPSHIFLIGNIFLSPLRLSKCTLYFSYGEIKKCYVDLELEVGTFALLRDDHPTGMSIHQLRRFFYSEEYETE